MGNNNTKTVSSVGPAVEEKKDSNEAPKLTFEDLHDRQSRDRPACGVMRTLNGEVILRGVRAPQEMDNAMWKWICTEDRRGVRNVPDDCRNQIPEVAHWYVLENVSSNQVNTIIRVADAVSSIFIRNDNDVDLDVAITGGPYNIFRKTFPAHSMQVCELFSEPLPYSAFPFADFRVTFSALPTTVLFRHLMWRKEIIFGKCNEFGVVSMPMSPGSFFYNVDGGIWTSNWPGLSIQAAQDKVDDHFAYLKGKRPASRRRVYNWSLPLSETKPGIYTFPPGHQIYSSIFVINPESRPIRLKLRPEPFRHDYLLQPGPNVFDLFWQEFWVPRDGFCPTFYFTCERSGLQIQLRCGNQCPPQKEVTTEYPETSPVLVSEFSGDAYIRSGYDLKFVSSNGRRQQAIQMILLGMHARIGSFCPFRHYFLKHELSERFLVPLIWDFL